MISKIKTDWDLTPVLKNESESEINKKTEEIKKAHSAFVNKWKNRTDYLEDPKSMKEALDDFEMLMRKNGFSGDLGYYFELKFCIDQSNAEIKSKLGKAEELGKEMRNNVNFFTLGISQLPKEKQTLMLASPLLKEYKHFLQTSFDAGKHLLSEKEEKILSLKESVAHDAWERMLQGIITKQEKEITINGKNVNKNFSDLLNLTEVHDKKTRQAAGEALQKIFSDKIDIAEAEINAILANRKINDELRNFPRPDSARHLEDDIPKEVVDALIETVSEHNDLSHRFFELKAKLLGLKKIKYYERNAPYGKEKNTYELKEAVELVDSVLSELDPEFSQILRRYLEKGQIDTFPKKGKKNGAFCIHLLPHQPVYIMLNHTGNLKDVTTIAHEVGHGINAEFMNRSQNALNIGTPKSTAEVASTFMEDFVLQKLLQEADDETRLSILMEKLNGDMGTIFRQTAFYKFEQDLHEKFRKEGYLSYEKIGALFSHHMKEYMGDFIDNSETDNWWIYVPHFRYIFYVYSYISGLLISKSLQAKVRENPEFIKKIKEFLSAGTSDSPVNIFKKLGIDITKKEFWLIGLKEMENLLTETEKLAKKLKKI